jgi:hypothetical protein
MKNNLSMGARLAIAFLFIATSVTFVTTIHVYLEQRREQNLRVFDRCVLMHGEGDAACEGCYYLIIEPDAQK